MPAVFSFDIFDTCIVRSLPFPEDLFLLMGSRLHGNSCRSDLEVEVFSREFSQARIHAERTARQNSPTGEVTLHEIYREMDSDHFGLESLDLSELEQSLELSHCFPVKSVQEKVTELQNQGLRVIFISDIYHSKSFILQMLQSTGYSVEPDCVYVSSEYRCRKETGLLYRLVLEKEKISSAQMVHFGDNLESDVQNARSIGIEAQHFTESALNRYEKRFLEDLHPTFLEGIQLVGLLRKQRLTSDRDLQSPAIAFSLAGPLLVSITQWVLESARQKKIRSLVFLSRDAQILFKIAQVLKKPEDPDLIYFQSSRKSTCLAAMREVSTREIHWALQEVDHLQINQVFQRLGISKSRWRNLSSSYPLLAEVENIPAIEMESDLCARILAIPEIRDEIALHSEQEKTALTDYLTNCGINGQTDQAFVDIGWRRGYQVALKKLFESQSWNSDFHVFYGFTLNPTTSPVEGTYSAYWNECGSVLSQSSLRFPWRVASLFEAIFTPSDHPPIERYFNCSGSELLKFQELPGWERNIEYARELHQAVLDLAREVKDSHLNLDTLIPRPTLLRNLCDFFLKPTYREIVQFRGFSFLGYLDNSASCRISILGNQEFLAESPSDDGGQKTELRSHELWPEAQSCILRRERALTFYQRLKCRLRFRSRIKNFFESKKL